MRMWTWLIGLCACGREGSDDTGAGATPNVLDGAVVGDVELDSVHALAFHSSGVLAIGDGFGHRLAVVELPEEEPAADFTRMDGFGLALSDALGGGSTAVAGMAVHPITGRVYIAAQSNVTFTSALLRVEDDGTLTEVPLQGLRHAIVPLPGGTNDTTWLVGLAWAGDHLVATDYVDTWTPSRLASTPLPVRHDDPAAVTSTSTYHRTHGAWETTAPIDRVFHFTVDGVDHIGASYTCAPVVRFPTSLLDADGEQVVGVTPFDFGAAKQVRGFAAVDAGVVAAVWGWSFPDAVDKTLGYVVDKSLLTAATDLDEDAPIVLVADGTPSHAAVRRVEALDGAVAIAPFDSTSVLAILESDLVRVRP